jgi:hypothetical protein
MAYGRPKTMSHWGPLSWPLSRLLLWGFKSLRDHHLMPIKLQAIPPLLEHLFPLTPLVCHFSASLSQSTPFPRVDRRLISMASKFCQRTAHGYAYKSIIELGFQFSKPLRCLGTWLCRSLQFVYDRHTGVDE